MVDVRLPVPKEEDFRGKLRGPQVAARLGLALGTAFALCLVTGVLSHLIQHPPSWFWWPSRPVWLYRATQGVHVLAGIAAVPLVLAKLYAVFPKLFTWPPVRSLVHGLERGSVLVLVGSALFELLTGLANIAGWYPWPFFFPAAHFAVAWVAGGSIVLHIAVKLPVIRSALGSPLETDDPAPRAAPSRRAFLAGTGVAAGVAVLATAGMTVPWLRRVSVLAVRDGEGPQGLPVNKSATAAGVLESARDPGWRLELVGPTGARRLTRDDLAALTQRSVDLPISCVEGWSAMATWTGVRVRDLVALVGGTGAEDVRFESLQRGGLYRESVLPAQHVGDPLSVLALRVGGQELDLDHGYPCRLIAPSRPGVLQTKWVSRVEVLA